uniref:Uncharacterized protein n=1 Tax=Parascaris univalens TaxID=6257 RepID=A0A914ZN49_PARUN
MNFSMCRQFVSSSSIETGFEKLIYLLVQIMMQHLIHRFICFKALIHCHCKRNRFSKAKQRFAEILSIFLALILKVISRKFTIIPSPSLLQLWMFWADDDAKQCEFNNVH